MDIKLVAIILCLSPTSIVLTSMLVCLLGYLKVAIFDVKIPKF